METADAGFEFELVCESDAILMESVAGPLNRYDLVCRKN